MGRTMPKPAGYHWDEVLPVARPDKRPPCRWCKGPCLPPRSKLCSASCAEEWGRRFSWNRTRRAVEKRDKGVCRKCGLDTAAVRRDVLELAKLYTSGPYLIAALLTHGRHLATVEVIRRVGLPFRAVFKDRHLWEADHIIPVAEGGDHFAMANLQTLCLVCHRAKTAEQAGRRAAANRAAKPKEPRCPRRRPTTSKKS